ncbi:DUF3606 domain-containing protein [uncultured Azohydromonas sp.]|jgi:Protein of unknown function (DUF3606).|uniref:DUF3606 domain-containing protein n=1 Tax=uncultured Azohydromonas sp. TaxID=487342 RepID=UPI00262D0AF1|nr:DUF3606 domain-containing protein [uncultured Azohydromonas sp.]
MATDNQPHPPGDTIDLNDEAAMRRWVDYFGVTATQLEEAVKSAGNRAEDVKQHLLNQGSSAGAS